MQEPRIIFAGGGDEHDSFPLDETFARWVGPHGRLLYLPIASMQPDAMIDDLSWLMGVYEPLGITQIETWMDLSGKTPRDLASNDAVYIGGGNTFYLLDQVRRSGLEKALVDFILAGHPAYGGSAGAILLSHEIASSAHMDPDVVGLDNLSALDLALGCSIWCHYRPADQVHIRSYVARTGIPSIAITERAGVCRTGSQLFAAGFEPALLFTTNAELAVAPGGLIYPLK